jgi:hypothetical protein
MWRSAHSFVFFNDFGDRDLHADCHQYLGGCICGENRTGSHFLGNCHAAYSRHSRVSSLRSFRRWPIGRRRLSVARLRGSHVRANDLPFFFLRLVSFCFSYLRPWRSTPGKKDFSWRSALPGGSGKSPIRSISRQYETVPARLRLGCVFRTGAATTARHEFLSQWRHAESRRKLPISVHESYWKAYYPGLDAPQIAEFGAKEMVEDADVVLVFSDPNSARTAGPRDYGFF